MMQPGGVSLTLSTDEKNLWWDNDVEWGPNHKIKKGWGIILALRWGYHLRPIPKLWKLGKWGNPWTTDDYWFVLRFPIIFPFISIAFGNFGTYLGLKFTGLKHPEVEKWSQDPKYHKYHGGDFVALSATIRKSRNW